MLQTIASNAAADSTEAQLETIAKKLVNTALTCDDEKDLEEEYDAKDSVEQSKVEKMEEEQLVKELPSISNDEDDVESKEEQDLESLSSVDPMDEEALIASKSFGIELQSAIDHVSSIAKDHREEMMSSIRLQIEEETKQDLGTLKEILDGGKDKVSAKNEEALKLLTKLHQAVNMNPKGHSKNKRTLARLKVDKIDKGKDEEKDKEVKLPAKYRVVIHPGALCKETKELSSKEVCKLPIGTVVTVVEIDGRRARVTSPSRGWLSLHASDGRIILQRSNTKSAAMDKAIHAERARQTKVLILKSITTLNDATVTRILEKSDWNLRRAIEAFYIAKYKTQEYLTKKEQSTKAKGNGSPSASSGSKSGPSSPSSGSKSSKGGKKGKTAWWKSWKSFAHDNP